MVSKQEEMREETEQAIRLGVCAFQYLGFDNLEMYKRIAGKVLEGQSRKGAVIRVARELPEPSVKVRGNYKVGYYTCRVDMCKADYVAIEPLIKKV